MVKVSSIAAVAMSTYFEQPPLEFVSIGRVVNLLIQQESNPVQLIIEKSGSTLTLFNGDGSDKSGDPDLSGSFTPELPVGSTKRYAWRNMLGDLVPDADTTMSIEGFVNFLVDEGYLQDDGCIVIDQARSVVLTGTTGIGTNGGGEEVCSFLNEESLVWE